MKLIPLDVAISLLEHKHLSLNSREAQETLTDVHGTGSRMSLTALLYINYSTPF